MAGNKRADNLVYFLIGMGVGAGGALMLAPKMGKEFREGLAGAAMLFANKVGEQIRQEMSEVTKRGYKAAYEITDELTAAGREISAMLFDESKKTIARTTEQFSKAVEDAMGTVDKSIGHLSEAIEAGKQAYTEEKYGRKMQS